jgi:hypothetical protein
LGRVSSIIELIPPIYNLIGNYLIYWEYRFGFFINIFISICFPCVIFLLTKYLSQSNLKLNIGKKILNSLLITVFVFSSINTTYLNIEYYSTFYDSWDDPYYANSLIFSRELQGIDFFQKYILSKDPYASVITISYSQYAVAIAAPIHQFGFYDLYSLKSPEFTFKQVYAPYTHPYIYLQNRDNGYLYSAYRNPIESLYFNNYIDFIPKIYDNDNVRIYNSTNLAPIKENSPNCLVLPYMDRIYTTQELFNYYLLSQANIDYTKYYENDDRIYSSENIFLGYDPVISDFSSNLIKNYETLMQNGGKLFILNSNGYNYFGESLFGISNSSMESNYLNINGVVYEIPLIINTTKINLKDESGRILGEYLNQDRSISIPFVIQKSIGQGTIIYINIFPIINHKNLNSNSHFPVLPLFESLFDMFSIKKYTIENSTNDETICQNIQISNATINSNHIFMDPDKLIYNSTFVFKNGTEFQLNNISRILFPYNDYTISVSQPNFKPLYSFYTKIQSDNQIVIDFKDYREISFDFLNDTMFYNDISKIILTPFNNSIELAIDKPIIASNEVEFEKILGSGIFSNDVGSNVHINGSNIFRIKISDQFYLIDHIFYNPEDKIVPPENPSTNLEVSIKIGLKNGIIITMSYFIVKIINKNLIKRKK